MAIDTSITKTGGNNPPVPDESLNMVFSCNEESNTYGLNESRH